MLILERRVPKGRALGSPRKSLRTRYIPTARTLLDFTSHVLFVEIGPSIIFAILPKFNKFCIFRNLLGINFKVMRKNSPKMFTVAEVMGGWDGWFAGRYELA